MKFFLYSFFILPILISIVIFNIYDKHFLLEINNNNYNNDLYYDNINYNYKRRYLSDLIKEEKNKSYIEKLNETFKNYKKAEKYFKSLQKKFKENLFEGNINYTNYTNNNLTNITKMGLMKMRIYLPYDKNYEYYENYPTFTIKILENKTIDNWIIISMIKNYSRFNFFNFKENIDNNLLLHSYNETFINISYNSKFEKSHYFSLPYYMTLCNFEYNIHFIENNLINNITKNITNNTNIKEIVGIKGSINSNNCKIKMDFNLIKHSKAIREYNNNIIFYCLLFSFISLFHLIDTKLLINKIDLSMVNSNSICIFTVCQNIIWNCYCCYNHFFLLLNYMEYKLFFLLICSLNFLNFGFIEFPLLYQLLSLRYSHLINDVLAYRKKIIQFCFIFYIILLFSFIYGMRFFYSPYFIFFSFIFTWLPQIIFNIYNKNRVSFPIIYIISVILNRIFPSFYFNIIENNFMRIPNNQKIEIINISILFLLTLILYSQTLFGPRWFLPMLQVEEYNFYIDEKDLRILKKDVNNLECLICLNPIIENKIINNIINYNNGMGFNETDNLVIEVNDNSLNYSENDKKSFRFCKFKYKNRCYGENSIFLNFHEFSKNIMNKPYMITPCLHVFHSECLEEWFKMKKECPNCRTEITQDMYN